MKFISVFLWMALVLAGSSRSSAAANPMSVLNALPKASVVTVCSSTFCASQVKEIQCSTSFGKKFCVVNEAITSASSEPLQVVLGDNSAAFLYDTLKSLGAIEKCHQAGTEYSCEISAKSMTCTTEGKANDTICWID